MNIREITRKHYLKAAENLREILHSDRKHGVALEPTHDNKVDLFMQAMDRSARMCARELFSKQTMSAIDYACAYRVLENWFAREIEMNQLYQKRKGAKK
ncbi:MAG: hypothetical protein M1353_07900 [Nitrospirae bacterium]|nr:hypothetical protein [Nitrospirota bacterium]